MSLVDPSGRPLGNGGPKNQEQDLIQAMARQRLMVLQTLGGMLLEAERKAWEKAPPEVRPPGWHPWAGATFTLRTDPHPQDGVSMVQVAPGLFGHLAVRGQKFDLVVVSCAKVREFLEAERATGNPTPDCGVDPVQIWTRASDLSKEQASESK